MLVAIWIFTLYSAFGMAAERRIGQVETYQEQGQSRYISNQFMKTAREYRYPRGSG
jgi:hypothetical protein